MYVWIDGEKERETKGGASEKEELQKKEEVETIPERKAGTGKGQKRTASIASPTAHYNN
jgi:hypothetical protein